MRPSRLLVLLPAAVLVAACVPMSPTPGSGVEGSCGAAGYQNLVGRDRSVAEDLRLVQPHRIYGPDEAVTMDYNPDRLNFVIGEDGNIEEVRCG
jgi:hypothetical protein